MKVGAQAALLGFACAVTVVGGMNLAAREHEGQTPIGAVLADPAAFADKPVTLRGDADDITRLPLLRAFEYRLTDNTGSLLVLSDSAPEDATRLKVRGDVHRVALFGFSTRPVLIESRRERSRLPW